MTLARLRVRADASPLPARIARLLADADVRLDALVADGLLTRLPHFAPSDYALVHGVLARIVTHGERGERMLEWGSGLGVIAGMAASLGLRASGIELDGALAEASRALLAAHALDVEIAEGSFLPEDYEAPAHLDESDSHSLARRGADGYEVLGRDLDEFRIVYAYPWPGVEPVFFHLFDTCAAPGALLVTYHGLDGCQVRRKRG